MKRKYVKKSELLSNTTGIKNSKFVASNTLKIEYENGTTAIRLHNTDVVTFDDKKIILDSGGWRTPTTKERINRFSPARIYQSKGIWYLRGGELFYDKCVIDSTGHLISKIVLPDMVKFRKIKKQITEYCNLITKDNLPYPENGDCFDCSLRTKEGESMGDVSKNTDHLFSHFKEGYLHGSILVNAMREAGYRDEQIGFHYQLKLFNTFKRVVRKYLTKRLLKNVILK